MTLNRKGQPDFGGGNASKIRREGLTGGGKIVAGQVHLKVNRSQPSESGLVVEPAIPGNNDVVLVDSGAKGDPLRLDFKAVPAKQFPQGNVAQVVGNAVVRLVICPPLALVHECQYERKQYGSCPQLGANFEAKPARLPK